MSKSNNNIRKININKKKFISIDAKGSFNNLIVVLVGFSSVVAENETKNNFKTCKSALLNFKTCKLVAGIIKKIINNFDNIY